MGMSAEHDYRDPPPEYMTCRHLMALGIRMVGLFSFVTTLGGVSASLPYILLNQQQNWSSHTSTGVLLICAAGFGLACMLYADLIAQFFVRDSDWDLRAPTPESETMYTFAVICVAFTALMRYLPSVASIAAMMLFSDQNRQYYTIPTLIGSAVPLLISLYFIIRARRFGLLLMRLNRREVRPRG
jgi:hypothetical protein